MTIKNLLLFVGLGIFLNSFISAQNPISFSIANCDNSYNGDYLQGEEVSGCPCYEQQTGGASGIIFRDGTEWLFSFDSNDCANPTLSSTAVVFTQTSCDITESTTVQFGCELADLTNVVYPSDLTFTPPVSFSIANCDNSYNGDYLQGEEVSGCPCYEQQMGGASGIIFRDGTEWLFSFDSNDCANPTLSSTAVVFTQTSCDITESTTVAFGCELADIINIVYPANNAVPTMGEWGLIILTLLLMSFGTVAIIRLFSANKSK